MKNVSASVRQQLLNLRQPGFDDYNTLLTQYVVERFLYRLSKSDLVDRFVLKGAMLFRVWAGTLHRPTKDLDLLGYGEASPAAVTRAVQEVIATPVVDDGLQFNANSVTASVIREEQAYGGIRVTLRAKLGTALIPMQIDVGFGDAITPAAEIRRYPTLLDLDAPELRMYPPETVVAEKIEAAVVLGMTNSRMKDYYDLRVIFRTYELEDQRLAEAIAATFQRRQTPLPEGIPPALSDEFGADPAPQRLWREFVQRLRIPDAPSSFGEVVANIRERMLPVLLQAKRLTGP